MTTKIWISRDGKGDNQYQAYFWNKKPTWNPRDQQYNCSDENCNCDGETGCTEIVVMDARCDDLTEVLKALGVKEFLQKGQIVEIVAKVTITQSTTLAQEARKLAKKIKSKKKPSQKELVTFLNGIIEDEDEENEDEENEDHEYYGG